MRFRSASFALVLGVCHHGQRVETFAPAAQAAGAEASIRFENGRVAGELLALDDSGFVLVAESRIVLVPFTAVKRIAVRDAGVELYDWREPPTGVVDRLRLVSRYPLGLAPELRARLLAAYGQREIDVLGR